MCQEQNVLIALSCGSVEKQEEQQVCKEWDFYCLTSVSLTERGISIFIHLLLSAKHLKVAVHT